MSPKNKLWLLLTWMAAGLIYSVQDGPSAYIVADMALLISFPLLVFCLKEKLDNEPAV